MARTLLIDSANEVCSQRFLFNRAPPAAEDETHRGEGEHAKVEKILIGAAIAPPDPVAVEAVAEPAGIPRRIISTLQTEGLFNDAASIVAFHLALVAVTDGSNMSWADAVTSFLYSAVVATT